MRATTCRHYNVSGNLLWQKQWVMKCQNEKEPFEKLRLELLWGILYNDMQPCKDEICFGKMQRRSLIKQSKRFFVISYASR